MEYLDQALLAARTFEPMSGTEVAAPLARTAPVAATGQFEPFKTRSGFGGASRNPQWRG